MKWLNITITLCFMMVFAVIFYNTEYLLTTPPSQSIGPDSMTDLKSAPLGGNAFIFLQVKENEYIKGGIGAAIGWVVKSVCEFLFALLKKGCVRLKGNLNES
jgi:hypothetical protein